MRRTALLGAAIVIAGSTAGFALGSAVSDAPVSRQSVAQPKVLAVPPARAAGRLVTPGAVPGTPKAPKRSKPKPAVTPTPQRSTAPSTVAPRRATPVAPPVSSGGGGNGGGGGNSGPVVLTTEG